MLTRRWNCLTLKTGGHDMKKQKEAAAKQATTPETPNKYKQNFWNRKVEVDLILLVLWTSTFWILTALLVIIL